jgi:hypothetical protein
MVVLNIPDSEPENSELVHTFNFSVQTLQDFGLAARNEPNKKSPLLLRAGLQEIRTAELKLPAY